MAANNFIGWNQSDLEAKLRELQEARLNLIMSASSGDASASNVVSLDHNQRLIDEVLAALSLLDPDAYPSTVRPVKRTTARYL